MARPAQSYISVQLYSVSVSVSVSVYFHHIYHTNEQYKENIGGENQKEQSSKWMVTQSISTNYPREGVIKFGFGRDVPLVNVYKLEVYLSKPDENLSTVLQVNHKLSMFVQLKNINNSKTRCPIKFKVGLDHVGSELVSV